MVCWTVNVQLQGQRVKVNAWWEVTSVCHHSCHFLCISVPYRSATYVRSFIWHSNQASAVGGVVTGWRITGSNTGMSTRAFFSRHTGPHRVSYSRDTRIVSRGINGRIVDLTTLLYLLPMLRTKVAIPLLWGTAVAQWLKCCSTNKKVAVSIPDGVIGIFHWHNPSDCTMALGSTQPLTEMSTRNISLGVKAADA